MKKNKFKLQQKLEYARNYRQSVRSEMEEIGYQAYLDDVNRLTNNSQHIQQEITPVKRKLIKISKTPAYDSTEQDLHRIEQKLEESFERAYKMERIKSLRFKQEKVRKSLIFI